MGKKNFTYNLSFITSCLIIFGAQKAYASCDNEYEACLKYHGGRCEDKLKSCNMTFCGEEECAPPPPAGIAAPAPAAPAQSPIIGNPYWNWPPENTTTTGGTTSTGVGATGPTGKKHH